ncbi:MAG TPA: hypothetical protein VHE81_03305, partial [Lacipirellulaceae bacterium]|nr:hypothetical protein [Lacipirellulaceae bacterium]
ERFLELDRREAANGRDELPQVCPKCGGGMEDGFIAALSTPRYLYPHYLSRWARGAPARSFLFGIWLPRELLPTRTYRCTSCGYLESYAREEFTRSWQSWRFSLRTLLIVVTIVAVVLGFLALLM